MYIVAYIELLGTMFMRLFGKLFGTRTKWEVLKLYSSISVDRQVTVDRQILVDTLVQTFEKYFGEAADSFDIHGPYGIRKGQTVGLKRFKTLLQSKGYDKFYALTITNKTNSKCIEFLDTSDDLERKVSTSGYRELIIGHQILEQQSDFVKVANEIYEVFKFDYGYITYLPENFDLLTEAKIMKGLLTSGTSVSVSDLRWRSQIQLILEGKLKDIYDVNILNARQFENIRSKVTDVKYLNTGLYTWTVDKAEKEKFKSLFKDVLL
jgi:hypothetical protein